MKKILTGSFTMLLIMIISCDKQNDDLVKPLTALAFPQVIKLDDEGDGGLEDEDEFSCTITLSDRPDLSGNEVAGTIVPLKADVTVLFDVKDLKGFTTLGNYVKGVSAQYEIDDCNTMDIPVQFNFTTGKGSVKFPKDVEEIELVFETDDNLFDDNLLNTSERSLNIELTGLTSATTEAVVVNNASSFTYEVLDDEAIHNDWEVDHTNATQFANFKRLFGLINEDIAKLQAGDVDKIEISIEYSEVIVKVELKTTQTVTECGTTQIENKEIEIETDIADLSTMTTNGDIELEGEVEQSNGSLIEFAYEGSFVITAGKLALTLQGEYKGNETPKLVLMLEK